MIFKLKKKQGENQRRILFQKKLKIESKYWDFIIILLEMVSSLKNAFGLLILLYFSFWIMVGWPSGNIDGTIADHLINGRDGEVRGEAKEKVNSFGREIFHQEFEATGEMGVKRKSNVVGQIFDYLRFLGRV